MEIFSYILAIVVLLLFIWSLVFTKKDSAVRDAILAIASVFTLSMCTADACLTSSKGSKIYCIVLSCLCILVLCIYILRLSKFDKKIKDLIENNSEVFIEKLAEYMSNGPSLRVDINSDADISYEILEKVRDELRKNSSIKTVIIHYEKELENKEIEWLLSNIFNGWFHPFLLSLKNLTWIFHYYSYI